MPINRKIGLPIDASWETCVFSMAEALTVKTGAGFPIKGGTFVLQTVAARVTTASSSGSVTVDVNKNGTSIYTGTPTNKPTAAASANALTVGAHDATTVTDGDWISVDVDAIGTGSADLVVVIRLQRTG